MDVERPGTTAPIGPKPGYFSGIEDPRIERTKQHTLLDIIIIAIGGMICGAEGWVEIEEFGKEKPAHWSDTLSRWRCDASEMK